MSEPPEAVSSADAAEQRAHTLDEALGRCYRHLGRREHSVAELRTRLQRAGLGAELIDEALAIVIEQGYVNDERYARLLAEDRRNLDGWGAQRIRARLEDAGIAPELIEQTLAGSDHASELAAAAALLERRCARGADQRPRAPACVCRADTAGVRLGGRL